MPQSELEFQRHIIKLAKATGWLHFHDYDSRRSSPGFPDLCLIRGRRVVFVELKSQAGRLSKDQKVWLRTIYESGTAEAYVLRPTDFVTARQLLAVTEVDPFQREAGSPIPAVA